MAPPSEPEKPIPMQGTVSPAPQEGIQAHHMAPEAAPCSTHVPAPHPQRGEGPGHGGGVLNPYASFMDTIYTSFLQVSAKEQEEAQAPALCALPPSTRSILFSCLFFPLCLFCFSLSLSSCFSLYFDHNS